MSHHPTTTHSAIAVLLSLSCIALVACSATAGRSATGPTSSARSPVVAIGVSRVQPGDCLPGVGVGESERIIVTEVEVSLCSLPHELEVYAAFDLEDESQYPGRETVVRSADEGCVERLRQVVQQARTAYGVISMWPTNESWLVGDRRIVCAAFYKSGDLFVGRELTTAGA